MPERLRLLHPIPPGERWFDVDGRDANAEWSVNGQRLWHGASPELYVEAEDAWLTGTFTLPKTLNQWPTLVTSTGTLELDPTDSELCLRWPRGSEAS